MQRLDTHEGALEFLEVIKRKAWAEFTAAGSVRPRAYVFTGKDPDGKVVRDLVTGEPSYACTVVYPDNLSSRRHVATYAGFMRDLIERTEACGIVAVNETWMAQGRNREDYPKDFGERDFPGRRESVMVLLEHVAFERPLALFANIARDAKGRGKLEPFWPGEVDETVKGNFHRFLKRRAS